VHSKASSVATFDIMQFSEDADVLTISRARPYRLKRISDRQDCVDYL
jgi:hypothetical protein